MRISRPLVAAVLLASLAACSDGAQQPVTQQTTATAAQPTLTITSPATGTTVKGNVVDLTLATTNFSVVAADGDTSGKTGHLHAFIDREPVAAGAAIPREAGIVHFATTTLRIPGLSVGAHKISVVLGDGTHTRIGSAVAVVDVTVAGPSLDASAPATVAAGAAVPVTVKVEGFTVVKADGDVSGKTGHLHLFVDRDPVAAGTVVPKEDGIIHSADAVTSVPGLAAGEHTIWVVAGDGAHKAFDPLIADKVVVTVATS